MPSAFRRIRAPFIVWREEFFHFDKSMKSSAKTLEDVPRTLPVLNPKLRFPTNHRLKCNAAKGGAPNNR